MRQNSLNHILSILLLAAMPALAATITGKVSVPAASESGGGAGGSYSRGVYRPSADAGEKKPAEKPGEQMSDIVVWAEPAGGDAPFRKPETTPKMIQQNKTFVPHVLPIQTGTTVDFPNLDPLYHNVFSYSRAKRFDLGRYEEGKSKTITFDQPGIVDVFCEIHENMHAYILVLGSPWFARAASDGTFELDVPAGRYRVFAWIPNRKSGPVEISLDQSSSEQVDFSF